MVIRLMRLLMLPKLIRSYEMGRYGRKRAMGVDDDEEEEEGMMMMTWPECPC